MSKYVILIKYYAPSPYSAKAGRDHYELFMHTKTKYPDNAPYFSSSIYRYTFHTIDKSNLPNMLKIAQNIRIGHNKTRQSKYGHIFILKLNSPKLKHILDYYKNTRQRN